MIIEYKSLSDLHDYEVNTIASIIATVYENNTVDTIISRLYQMTKYEDYQFCIAYEDKDICGIGIYKFDWRMWGGRIIYIDTLAAYPTGKGIGRTILNDLAAKAARNQCAALQLECRVENENAARFYYDYGMEKRAGSFIRRL